jgi:hypothetical protein
VGILAAIAHRRVGAAARRFVPIMPAIGTAPARQAPPQ